MSFDNTGIETSEDNNQQQQKASRQQQQDSTDSKESYKTPQQLFSSFQIPDIDSPATSDTSSNTDTPVSPISPAVKKSPEKPSKLQSIKPNIIKQPPTQLKLTSSFPTMHSPKVFPTSVHTNQTTGKPLLVQAHTNAHQPFYFMNQNSNGFIGYQAPMPPTTAYQPNMYGLSSPFVDPRFIYSPSPPPSHAHASIIKKDTATTSISKEIKMLDSSPTSSALKQTCASIQGQMAANQIPLCLVQDSQGQLHQLVYTVPENLYEKYVAAAKKGFKVRVQPHLDSLKVALSNSGPKPSKLDDENEKRIFNDEDLQLVKEIKLNEQNKTKTEKQEFLTEEEKSKVKVSEKVTKTSTTMSVLKLIKENSSTNKNEKEQLTTSTTRTGDVTNALIPTITTTSQLLLSNQSHNNDMLIHSQGEVVSSLKSDIIIDDNRSKTPVKIDLTSSPITVGGNFETEQSPPSTQQNKMLMLQRKTLKSTLDDEKVLTKTTSNENQMKPPTPHAENDFVLDDLTEPNESNELFHNINTIDGILAKNSNALIPKSDVEALLRCLKRKLEENDIAEHLSKRHKLQEGDSELTNKTLSDNRKAFHTKCNSYDYDSLDMLSPESLPEDENSVFYSNTDIPSVSSLESSNNKTIPSVTSSLDAFDTSVTGASPEPQNISTEPHLDLFDNFRDDFFSADNFVYPDILPNTSDILPNTSEKLTNTTNFNNPVVNNDEDKMMNSTFSFPSGQQNYDMDLFDHLWSELDNL